MEKLLLFLQLLQRVGQILDLVETESLYTNVIHPH